MRGMRIGLAQINPTVGDITGNARKIVEFTTVIWRPSNEMALSMVAET